MIPGLFSAYPYGSYPLSVNGLMDAPVSNKQMPSDAKVSNKRMAIIIYIGYMRG